MVRLCRYIDRYVSNWAQYFQGGGMTERYTGKLHHLREQARTRWGEVREQGGAREAVTKQVIQIITRA